MSACCDDRIDEIDYDEPTDLVAINVETSMAEARRAYEIADEYRARRVPGSHGRACTPLRRYPHEVAAHADAVFAGDG